MVLVLGGMLPVTKCAFGLPFSRDGRTPLEEIRKRFWCGEQRYRSQNVPWGCLIRKMHGHAHAIRMPLKTLLVLGAMLPVTT